jgi:hypothetical protein
MGYFSGVLSTKPRTIKSIRKTGSSGKNLFAYFPYISHLFEVLEPNLMESNLSELNLTSFNSI